ncbi:phosphotransferase enzyme family protein [Nannizzia gypsea CBS 118893]|uniref:Phosphotransferase enzyme family protein n=1 Tax=Arthroderma gypseum (strain ATCC MYA-4604 / CBS 118893) TaxID=535722 RepID=E4V1X4_ARTGP|nr:phosphotransferase enzyme family protein [Nannizzia gypsea CBS 118893]EFR04039.1 phosphotransferase enzyme family protein [Nannizzia gypsea CBS 118893]
MAPQEVEADWNLHDEFFNFTRGRFVLDEKEQMSKRRVSFDMNELARIAASSVGAKRCINIEKCADGMFNKAYVFTLDNERQVIGKVPNPNAGIPHYTTASEVATIDFMRNVLKTPAPEVYAWSSRLDGRNKVGAEYMIMEKLDGIPLGKVWPTLDPADQMKIFLQVFDYQRVWTATKFASFGSLYYTNDLDELLRKPLFAERDGQTVKFDRFAIGPATGREWSDDGRDVLKCDRGPWKSVYDYRRAIGLREKFAIECSPRTPKQLAMLYGPGLYQPTRMKRLRATQSYLELLEILLPDDPSLANGHLWHDDLHSENIFVNREKPTEVVGIIDWQSTQISPLFDHCMDPSFLDYNGAPIGDSLKRPELPKDYNSLPECDKKEVIKHYYDKSVMVAWRMLVKQKNPSQYTAAMFENTTKGYLLLLSRRLYELGEPQFHALSLDLWREWLESHPDNREKVAKFPLAFSDETISEIDADREAAQLSAEAMKSIQQRLGELWPEKSLIEHGNYEEFKASLLQIKEELAAELALTPEERDIFHKFWPFDD